MENRNIVGVTKTKIDLEYINKQAKTELYDLISFCEKRYQDEIEVIANNIVYGSKRFILLAGPSSSGKTTTSMKICEALNNLGRNALSISLDDFFKDRCNYPLLEDGSYDFENFDIVDVKFFNKCLQDLLKKGETDLPTFDFISGTREKELRHVKITEKDIIIIEGTHALNPKLITFKSNLFYRLYVCVYTDFVIGKNRVIPAKLLRFLRRLYRDVQARGTSIQQTLEMWNNVCIGEDKYIKPYRSQANYLLDTTHLYEPLLYHTYLKPLLEENLNNKYASELYEKLELCGYLTREIIPEHSLLWEFMVKNPTNSLL